jgi:hypothetical protein
VPVAAETGDFLQTYSALKNSVADQAGSFRVESWRNIAVSGDPEAGHVPKQAPVKIQTVQWAQLQQSIDTPPVQKIIGRRTVFLWYLNNRRTHYPDSADSRKFTCQSLNFCCESAVW